MLTNRALSLGVPVGFKMPTTVKAPCLSFALPADAVRGPELVAHFQPELLGRGGPGHGVEEVVLAEVLALGELVMLDRQNTSAR